jgi:hypothetical protein
MKQAANFRLDETILTTIAVLAKDMHNQNRHYRKSGDPICYKKPQTKETR